MMISTKGRYALRALIDLAEHAQDGSYVPLADVAERQNISEKYLESIISSLSKAGLVVGLRGKGGGYRLAKKPDEYPLSDILRTTEGTLAPVACLVCDDEGNDCSRRDVCPTYPVWKGLDDTIANYLGGITIADLMQNDRMRSGLVGVDEKETPVANSCPSRNSSK